MQSDETPRRGSLRLGPLLSGLNLSLAGGEPRRSLASGNFKSYGHVQCNTVNDTWLWPRSCIDIVHRAMHRVQTGSKEKLCTGDRGQGPDRCRRRSRSLLFPDSAPIPPNHGPCNACYGVSRALSDLLRALGLSIEGFSKDISYPTLSQPDGPSRRQACLSADCH